MNLANNNITSAFPILAGVNEKHNIHQRRKEILNRREKEVLTAIVMGKKYKEIADKLFISISTVNFHKKNLYKKLDVHSQTEAVLSAIRNGII